MNDLQFHVHLNTVGCWEGENIRLGSKEARLRLERLPPPAVLKPGTLNQRYPPEQLSSRIECTDSVTLIRQIIKKAIFSVSTYLLKRKLKIVGLHMLEVEKSISEKQNTSLEVENGNINAFL